MHINPIRKLIVVGLSDHVLDLPCSCSFASAPFCCMFFKSIQTKPNQRESFYMNKYFGYLHCTFCLGALPESKFREKSLFQIVWVLSSRKRADWHTVSCPYNILSFLQLVSERLDLKKFDLYKYEILSRRYFFKKYLTSAWIKMKALAFNLPVTCYLGDSWRQSSIEVAVKSVFWNKALLLWSELTKPVFKSLQWLLCKITLYFFPLHGLWARKCKQWFIHEQTHSTWLALCGLEWMFFCLYILTSLTFAFFLFYI